MAPTTTPAPTGRDPLMTTADRFPQARSRFSPPDPDPRDRPSAPGVRPFGLSFATANVAPVVVDVSALRYDADRQLSVDDAGVPVFAKHSTGKTSTRTSDGHKSMDSDTDHTKD